MILWKLGKKALFGVIFLFAISSFGYSEWGWKNDPIGAFYSTHARIWEIFLGVLAAMITQERSIKSSNLISLIGFLWIVLPICLYDVEVFNINRWILITVFGTFLIILFARPGTTINQILSYKGLVWIGLISYSLYLWHLPLLAFARINSIGDPPLKFKLFYVFLHFL